MERTPKRISGPHCQQCGSTDPEDVMNDDLDGYSGCCNEIIVNWCDIEAKRPDGDIHTTCYHYES